MEDRADTINSICRRLHEVEGLLRVNKMEKIDGKWEMTNLNKAEAVLDNLRREVAVLSEDLYHAHNEAEEE